MARKGRAKALPPKMLTVYGDIVQETEDAILLRVEGEEHWLPKSQIEYIGERGDTDVEVSIPDWLADEQALSDGDGKRQETGAAPAEEPAAAQPDEDDTPETKPSDAAKVDLDLVVARINEDDTIVVVDDADKEYTLALGEDCTFEGDMIAVGCRHIFHITQEAAAREGLSAGDDKIPAVLRGRDVRWLKKDSSQKAFPLSDDDKLQLGEEMAAAQERIDDLEDELADIRKDFKARIEAEQVRLSKAAKEFREGKTEPQDVECDVFQDFDSGEIVYVTADEAAEIVFRRPMTADEKQPSLFDAPPATGKADAPATTEPTPQTWGHTCVTCGHLDDSPEGQQAEECATCTQSGSGSVDNWTPRRVCATCNYKNTQVGLPPCSSCTRNPQTDATTAEDDNWIIAAQPESAAETPADAEPCGEPVAVDDAEPQAGTALQ